MTDIEREALALLNEQREVLGGYVFSSVEDAAHTYRQTWPVILAAVTKLHAERAAHAQFRQDVSDALRSYFQLGIADDPPSCLARFIIDKPDPLIEIMAEVNHMNDAKAAEQLRAALAARGLQITEIDNG